MLHSHPKPQGLSLPATSPSPKPPHTSPRFLFLVTPPFRFLGSELASAGRDSLLTRAKADQVAATKARHVATIVAAKKWLPSDLRVLLFVPLLARLCSTFPSATAQTTAQSLSPLLNLTAVSLEMSSALSLLLWVKMQETPRFPWVNYPGAIHPRPPPGDCCHVPCGLWIGSFLALLLPPVKNRTKGSNTVVKHAFKHCNSHILIDLTRGN